MERNERVVKAVRSDECERDIQRLERLAHLFDAAFRIPGIGIRVGWDSIVGFVPGVGDLLGVAPLLYYIKVARAHRLKKRVYARLIWNQGIDFLIGLVPLVGDLADIGWKANLKNARILAEALRRKSSITV